jgi:hypothetical protein
MQKWLTLWHRRWLIDSIVILHWGLLRCMASFLKGKKVSVIPSMRKNYLILLSIIYRQYFLWSKTLLFDANINVKFLSHGETTNSKKFIIFVSPRGKKFQTDICTEKKVFLPEKVLPMIYDLSGNLWVIGRSPVSWKHSYRLYVPLGNIPKAPTIC